MKLATSLLLGLAAQAEEKGEKFGYGSGGCSDWQYGYSPSITCKTECKGVQKVGRGKNAGLTWVMDSANTLMIKLKNNKVKKPNKQPKPKQPYIGFIRLDEKFCPGDMLPQLADGFVGLDIGDKYYSDDVQMCSRTLVTNTGEENKLAGKASLLYQFKKKSWHAAESKKNFDIYNVVMSNMAMALQWSNGTTHADYKTCLGKAFVYAMKADPVERQTTEGSEYNGEEYNDYTKCILYDEFAMEIDWTEEPPDTTTGDWSSVTDNWSSTDGNWTTGDWSTGDWTTTTEGGTTVQDEADLIPEGVKCPANQVGGRAGKIVNGSQTKPHSWRWMASLRVWGGHSCGGSILNDNHILSAAHCCQQEASSYTIRIGDHSEQQSDGETEYEVEEIINHPEYGKSDGYSYNWDFCILKTKTKMKLDGVNTDIVCLPDQGDHVEPSVTRGFVGDKCFVAGWGTLASGGNMPDKLQSVKVAIYDHDYCMKHSAYGDTFHEPSEFCAGKMDGGKDSCQGDSGGPLICVNEQNQPILTGIVSWGYGCAAVNYPGIYAKASAATDWIVLTVGGGSTTENPNTEPTDEPTGDEDFEQGVEHLPAGLGGDDCGDEEGSGDDRKRRFAEDGGKIAGGAVVQDDVWKWIATMNVEGEMNRCTGSILNDDWIVTAGHCCAEQETDTMYFVIGEFNIKQGVHDKGQFNVKAEKVIMHEKYGATNGISHDICLVKVENMAAKAPAACKDCYTSICLPNEHVDAGKHCWVAGWGGSSPATEVSNKLRDVGLNVMSHNYCMNKSTPDVTGAFMVQEDVEFCAGIPDRDENGLTDAGKGVCSGDGGGPFVCIENEKAVLTGMVSWSFGCGAEGKPTVFTKMAAFRDWIMQNMMEDPATPTV